jgi:hypothetical protein
VAGITKDGCVDGAARGARFYLPLSLCMDPAADGFAVLVCDSDNHRVRRVDLQVEGQALVSTVCGVASGDLNDGPVSDARIGRPLSIASLRAHQSTGAAFLIAAHGGLRILSTKRPSCSCIPPT